MALAGLWENWRSPAGEWVRSFAIITTTPNELCAEIHNRMPVILPPEAWPTWLGEQPADARQLKSLLAPYPSDDMMCWPVSTRVGSVKKQRSGADRAAYSAIVMSRRAAEKRRCVIR
jgi:putative SOS response-associated peptidase YedK